MSSLPHQPSRTTLVPEHPQGISSASLENLPLELITEIVQYLRVDTAALAACSSLNRAWRSFCLSYLFEAVEMKRPKENTLLNFCIFLESHQTIRRLITRWSVNTSSQSMFIVPSTAVVDRILRCLPNLNALTICRTWFLLQDVSFLGRRAGPPELYKGVAFNMPGPYTLRALVVDRCLAGPTATTQSLPRLFKDVIARRFRMGTLFMLNFEPTVQHPLIADNEDRWPPREIIHKFAVDHLHLGPAPSREYMLKIVEGLCTHLAPSFPRYLTLVGATQEGLQAMQGLFRRIGRTLTGFSLDATGMKAQELEDSRPVWDLLQVRHCARIRDMAFRVVVAPIQDAPSLGPPLCRALAQFLEVAPRNLRTIVIVLKVQAPEPLPPVVPSELAGLSDFPAIERALLQRALPGLSQVKVSLNLGERVEKRHTWVAEVRKLLPRLQASGHLVVTDNMADTDPFLYTYAYK